MINFVDPSFEKLIVPGVKIDSIAGGFGFTEGPVMKTWKVDRTG
jgi:hypothetical protein